MARTLGLLLFFALAALNWACQGSSYLSVSGLREYLLDQSNGVYKSETIGAYKVEVIYRPGDLLAAQELALNNAVSDSLWDRLKEKYARNLYFDLRFSLNDGELLHGLTGEEYANMVNILSFRMKEYVFITSGKDTLKVKDFMLDRTFGKASSTNLLLAFDRNNILNDKFLEFHIKKFDLGYENPRFRFKGKDIERVPKVTFCKILLHCK